MNNNSELIDNIGLTLREIIAIFPKCREIKRLVISDAGTPEEIYDDPLTHSEKWFHDVVPVASNDSLYTYVCPRCHRFHLHERGLVRFSVKAHGFEEWFPFPCDEFSFWMEPDKDEPGKYQNMIHIIDKTGKHTQEKSNDQYKLYEKQFL